MEKAASYSPPITNSTDEIDLSLLGLRIVNALQRSLKLLIMAIILGSLIGFLIYSRTPPVYETSMIASSKVLTNIRVENLIEVLDRLAKEQNQAALAKKFNISLRLAGYIQQVSAKSIKEDKQQTAEDKNDLDDNVFEVTLSTSNNQQVDSLQAGILYYLQHNDFVQKRIAIQKQNLETMLGKVKEEQKKLDSLRFSVNKLLARGIGNNSTMLMTDPASVNKDILALYEKELKIKSDLLLIDDIQVIQDFTQFSKPSGPKLLQNVAASTGSAVTLALIIIAILEARRGMRKLKNTLEHRMENKEVV